MTPVCESPTSQFDSWNTASYVPLVLRFPRMAASTIS
jgi:hypothetical protein